MQRNKCRCNIINMPPYMLVPGKSNSFLRLEFNHSVFVIRTLITNAESKKQGVSGNSKMFFFLLLLHVFLLLPI